MGTRNVPTTRVYLRVLLILLFLFTGCDVLGTRTDEYSEVVRYEDSMLEPYSISESTPAAVIRWFHLNNREAGVFCYFYDTDLYFLATYDQESYQQLMITDVLIKRKELTVTVHGGRSVLVPGTADRVDAYYSNIYKIPEVGFARKAELVVISDMVRVNQ